MSLLSLGYRIDLKWPIKSLFSFDQKSRSTQPLEVWWFGSFNKSLHSTSPSLTSLAIHHISKWSTLWSIWSFWYKKFKWKGTKTQHFHALSYSKRLWIFKKRNLTGYFFFYAISLCKGIWVILSLYNTILAINLFVFYCTVWALGRVQCRRLPPVCFLLYSPRCALSVGDW